MKGEKGKMVGFELDGEGTEKNSRVGYENVKPYPRNAKKHPDKQLKKIAASLAEFGWRQPIVVDKDMVIIVGHGRWFAWEKYGKQMGIPAPWVQVAADLTKEQVKAYRLADNKLNESDWDMELVIDELHNLSLPLLEITGFEQDLVTDLEEDNFDAEEEYKKIKSPKTKLGDVWRLGEHRLMCGDSTKEEDVKKLMDGQLADLVFTDPPYNVDYKSSGGHGYASGKYASEKIFNDNKSAEDFVKFLHYVFDIAFNFTQEHANLYCWHAMKTMPEFREGMQMAGWKYSQTIIWLKEKFILSMGQDFHRCFEPCMIFYKNWKKRYINKKYAKETDVWDVDRLAFEERMDVWFETRDLVKNYKHPTQKPVRLAERALKRNTERGHVVLDVFAGSGSTLMACEQAGRKCYTMELDPRYCDVVVKRYEQFTNKKATKVA